jgi:DNA polymerase-1
MKKDLLDLLSNVQEDGPEIEQHERYMLIDGLNLFFRNFSAINTVNSNGAHIGGLGGFFRSLGTLTRQIQPTQIIVVFDGTGSSTNRKNIIPEYKSNRGQGRVTKHELFDDVEEEDESKIAQITRIIQYLKTLPVKILTLSRVEADDVIAFLSKELPKHENDRVFIVSSDKDYLQLVDQQTIVYRPIEREFYTEDTVKQEFNLEPHNFILYKTLLGDQSDSLPGIKGLGVKKLYKLFPELAYEDKMSLNDILDICEKKLKEHVIYARVLSDVELLENKYKIMDLSNPMISEKDKGNLITYLENTELEFHPDAFVKMCNEDQLDSLLRNVDFWVKDNFQDLLASK